MSRKLFAAVLLVSAILTLAGISPARAEDPSQLIVIRGADDSIWKKTCVGNTCTDFVKIPGTFASPLTIVWDEVLQQYVAWGRATNDSIWKATFSKSGAFDNNWAQVAGSTIHTPISVASPNLARPRFGANRGDIIDIATIGTCDTYTNLSNMGFTPPRDGFILVTASGLYTPDAANSFVRVCIGDDDGATGSCDGWSPIMESSSVTGYTGEKTFALQRYFLVNAGTSINVHLKACREAGATGSILWNDFSYVFHVTN